MIKVIGVRFRQSGKVYFFNPGNLEIKDKDAVIVETARGIEYGNVVMGTREIDEGRVVQPLKSVIRLATEADIQKAAKNREKERQAFQVCREKIQKHNLDMKLIDTEYTFDNNKVLFYFTADGRIDFRELVKDLASIFKTRIELRQIGVRDETKILGGIGICGRALCCHSYLSDFAPVSIRMAKEQNLSLNPSKISGVCGRLMCCLKNEEETYEYLNNHLPKVGDTVITPDDMKGEVQNVSVLRQQVKVIVNVGRDDREIREYKVDDLKFKRRVRTGKNGAVLPGQDHVQEDAQYLEALERVELAEKEQESQQTERPTSGERGRDRRRSDDRAARGERSGGYRDNKGNRGGGDGRDNRENRGGGDGRDNRENRGGGEGRDNRENRNGRRRPGRSEANRDKEKNQSAENPQKSERAGEKSQSSERDSREGSRRRRRNSKSRNQNGQPPQDKGGTKQNSGESRQQTS